MQKWMVMVVVLLAFQWPGGAKAEPSLDGLIGSVERFYNDVTDFKALFRQEVKRAHLSRTLKKSGQVFYLRPGKMRWDYTEPDRVYYISDGDVLWAYEVAIKQAIKTRIRDSELYDSLKFLFGDGDLRASFKAALGANADGLQALVLTPHSGQRNYKTLTLWVKPETGQVMKTEVVDPLDNISIITFTDVSYDKLKPEGFQFTPPKGTRIQDLTGDPDTE